MKHIVVVEGRDEIVGLTKKEFAEFVTILEGQGVRPSNLLWRKQALKVMNYVGVVCGSSFIVELLPKVAIGDDYETMRCTLWMMLQQCGDLPVHHTQGSLVVASGPLFPLFMRLFAEETLRQLQRGIVARYREVEDNLSMLKGSLRVAAHVRHNVSRKRSSAYCRYEEHSRDHDLNGALLAASLLLVKCTTDRTTERLLYQVIHLLDGVTPVWQPQAVLDRTNERYRVVYELALQVLRQQVSQFTAGATPSFALLFEMNVLFERYIGRLVQRVADASLQDKTHHLFKYANSERAVLQLKPDIVVNRGQLIIDTKWKSLQHGVKREDFLQMYAYLTSYAQCETAVLLYPDVESERQSIESWYVPYNPAKKLRVHTITLADQSETIRQLEQIVTCYC